MKLERLLALGLVSLGLAACNGSEVPVGNGEKSDSGIVSCVKNCEPKDSGFSFFEDARIKDDARTNQDAGLDTGALDTGVLDSGFLDARVMDSGVLMNRVPVLNHVLVYDVPYLPNSSITERRQRDTLHRAVAVDPDGDSLEYQFEIKDSMNNVVRTRTWNPDHRFLYAVQQIGTYNLTVKARDTQGLESLPASFRLDVVNNIPPVPVITCTERDPNDGKCVFRMRVRQTHCWDLSMSYDLDGQIVDYRVRLNQSTIGGVNDPNICGGYTVSGIYNSAIIVIDDESAESSQAFYSIVN